ncbi:PRC-barrel domain-containing protein [Plantactinospora sp. CA-290183]|uniref:PRC-barrel domain-containing protein n=1 Tax=Plantactinospora sp. CA-290183 TaxID=3240006 RepID=UPI003D93E621
MDRLDPQNTPSQEPTSALDARDGAFERGALSGAFDPWRYRDDVAVTGGDLVGYKVEASDGGIGKIDRASSDVDASYLVVDTGPWIFGKKVMLPAGVVNDIDHDERKVYVDRNKDQIKAAPEYEDTVHDDPAYRERLGGYYGGTYGATGWASPPGRVM